MSQAMGNMPMPSVGIPAGQEMTIVVTAMDLNVMLAALHEAPMAAKFTLPVITKLQAYLMTAPPARPNGGARPNIVDEDAHIYRRGRET